MRPTPRFWQSIASRVDLYRRAERQQPRDDITAIVNALSHHAAQEQRHDAAEDFFWRGQITAAWWLNWITLTAAIIAIVTVGVLIFTLIDTRKDTVEANRAWLAPRSAYLQRPLVLNDHPGFRVTYDNVGKQPALNIALWWRVSIFDADALIHSLADPTLAETAFGENPACSGHTSHKGAEIAWPSSLPEKYSSSYLESPNDPIITQGVLDGRESVVVQGCFFYETFQEVHRSAFCFWFRQVPPSNMLTTTSSAIICPIGNDAN
jgi:hypothetical protein